MFGVAGLFDRELVSLRINLPI